MNDNQFLDVASYCHVLCTIDAIVAGSIPYECADIDHLKKLKQDFLDSILIPYYAYSPDKEIKFSNSVSFAPSLHVPKDVQTDFWNIRKIGFTYVNDDFPTFESMQYYANIIAKKSEENYQKIKKEDKEREDRLEADKVAREKQQKEQEAKWKKDQAEIEQLKQEARKSLKQVKNKDLKDRWTPEVDALVRDNRISSSDIAIIMGCSSTSVSHRRKQLEELDICKQMEENTVKDSLSSSENVYVFKDDNECQDVNNITQTNEIFRTENIDSEKSIADLYQNLINSDASTSEKINCLEEYKKKCYEEKWAYELAKLYESTGEINKCISECDDLYLWFAEGPWVYKALKLKKKYQPLSPAQQKTYDTYEKLNSKSKEQEKGGHENAEQK